MAVRISPTGARVGGRDVHADLGIQGPSATVSKSDGDVGGSLSVGADISKGSFGVSPTVRIGGSQAAHVGSQTGSIAGSLVAGPFGAAAGSAAGSALGEIGDKVSHAFNHKGKGGKEADAREKIINSFRGAGVFGSDPVFTFPDGSTFDFNSEAKDTHGWKNPSQRLPSNADRNTLHSYDIDYTNDLDYVSGMAGSTLSRILAGGKGTAIDQTGNTFGNAFLGKVGYGQELTNENFQSVMRNARASYAQKGISTKTDLLALANKAFSEHRIDDADYAVMQQTAGLVFDNNYNLAQTLMGGRHKGLETAARTPSRENRPGRIYSPLVGPEEAMLSVQPFFDAYRKQFPQVANAKGASKGAQNIVQGIAAVSAITAGLKTIDNATGNIASGAVKDIYQGTKDIITGGSSSSPSPTVTLGTDALPTVTGVLPDFSVPEDLPDLSSIDSGGLPDFSFDLGV